ncbi:MAG: very short patch repair endonuclease [Candidatus Acidiferrum sp.]
MGRLLGAMSDIFTRTKRSAVMSRIRGRGNKDTELRIMALFQAHRINGWRRGVSLFGKPDFVFRRERVALFVDGCFWHRHLGCKFSYTPKSRTEFWLPKFERNVARDRLVTRTLRKAGWRVVRIWECQLTPKKQARVLRKLRLALTGSSRPQTSTRSSITTAKNGIA